MQLSSERHDPDEASTAPATPPASEPVTKPASEPARRPATAPSSVAVLGATGYVGGRLVPRLLAEGHRVRCVVRRPEALTSRSWGAAVEVVRADLAETDADALAAAFDGIDVVFHLVHSMTDGDDFSAVDRSIAETVRDAAARAAVHQIVYLGGLGDDRPDQSNHLASRHEVGRVLASGPTAVTELRAAVILGSGSASFEMLRSLVEVLPIMVVPRWVDDTRCQPVAVSDVIDALAWVVDQPSAFGQILDLGGGDVLTYRGMIDGYADAAGLHRRIMIGVPVLSPKLSSWWVNLVTPLPLRLARSLVASLTSDVVVRADHAFDRLHPTARLGYQAALQRALEAEGPDVGTRWSDAALAWRPEVPMPQDPHWAGATQFTDRRQRDTTASPAAVFTVICSLGGGTGWFGADWLWQLRGLMDKAVGGVGLRRGRRHGTHLRLGDALDWWRVAAIEPDERLVLQAEVKLPGKAWLSWELEARPDGGCLLRQQATYVPHGIAGRAYWLAVLPFHQVIFPRLIRRICRSAETAESTASAASTASAS